MKLSLRTQQIIAEETNVTQVIDPLGGSYYMERLTADMEAGVRRYFDAIDELGGTLAAIDANFFQKEIADFAYEFAQRKASGDRTVVGVNKFVDAEETQQIEVHRLDPDSERRKITRLKEVKESRDQAVVRATLAELKRVAALPDENIMPATIAAVEANASMGEIVKALETVFGRYTERPVF
jgi:methylmalonyl-CoA mutase N-terminal domain/subunit